VKRTLHWSLICVFPCSTCRWCAEGGNLICCDYCSNAFCKKCILRNLGRKELSGILESKWYCYVCNPEPLLDLVVACDSVLENLECLSQHHHHRRHQAEPEKEHNDMLPPLPQIISLEKWSHSSMDGNVVFNYNVLDVPKDLMKNAKHLMDSTNTLNRTFVEFIKSVRNGKGTCNARPLYLKSFLLVLKGLRKSHALLEESLKEEFCDVDLVNSCDGALHEHFDAEQELSREAESKMDVTDECSLTELQNLAAEHLDEEDSDSKRLTQEVNAFFAEKSASQDAAPLPPRPVLIHPKTDLKLSHGLLSMKTLVVKLIQVPVEQQEQVACIAMGEGAKVSSMEAQGTSGAEEKSQDVGLCLQNNRETEAAPLEVGEALRPEEEPDNRRSPRVKTTPLRRPSDVKPKPSVSTNDSGSDSDPGIGDTDANLASDASARGCGDSDEESDEVPAALLQRAAMTHSSDDDVVIDDAAPLPTQVEKKCLIRLSTATPLSPKRVYRKRKVLYSEASGRKAKVRRVGGSDSSNDDLKEEKEAASSLVDQRVPLGAQDADSAPTPSDIPSKCLRENQDSSSPSSSSPSASRSEGEEVEQVMGSDSDDQRMKPITETVSMLGASGFQQSSGKTSSAVALKYIVDA